MDYDIDFQKCHFSLSFVGAVSYHLIWGCALYGFDRLGAKLVILAPDLNFSSFFYKFNQYKVQAIFKILKVLYINSRLWWRYHALTLITIVSFLIIISCVGESCLLTRKRFYDNIFFGLL